MPTMTVMGGPKLPGDWTPVTRDAHVFDHLIDRRKFLENNARGQ
jgi:hypothetical protein